MLDKEIKSMKHFCILPWVHLMMHQNGEAMACCRDGELGHSFGNLKKNSLEEVWNGEKIREMRLSLLNDESLSQCRTCYHEEKLGITSLRKSSLENFPQAQSITKHTGPDGSLPVDEIKYLGIRLSNECKLKCRTCSPGNSVSWYKDAEFLSGKKFKGVERLAANNENMLLILNRPLKTIQQLYFAGGEPLIQKQHYFLLETLIAMGRTDIHLMYNSSLTQLEYRHWKAVELWNHFSHVTIDASFDAVGAQAEFLRKGSDWKSIENNVKFIEKNARHVKINVCPTISVMNAFQLPVSISGWLACGMIKKPGQLKLNLLQFPKYFNLKILNNGERARLKKILIGYLKLLSSQIEPELYRSLEAELSAVITECDSPQYWAMERKLFRWVTFKLDKLRNEKFLSLFPEHLELLCDPMPQPQHFELALPGQTECNLLAESNVVLSKASSGIGMELQK